MKQIGILFFLMALVACRQQNVPVTAVKGEIWLSDSTAYYDIQVVGPYISLLTQQSDTVLQMRPLTNARSICKFGLKGESFNTEKFENPVFVKSLPSRVDKEKECWIVDNNVYLKKIRLDKEPLLIQKNMLFSTTQSKDYNFTTQEMYAVSTEKKDYLFYFFSTDSGYYWVDIPSINDCNTANDMYLTNLCVNEREGSIVSANRFSNVIQFLDMRGGLRNYAFTSDSIIRPVLIRENRKEYPRFHRTRSNDIDILHSTKCFIDIYGTEKYVYLLYNGFADYSHPSSVYIYQWDGKPVSILKTDYPLIKIAVDKDDEHLFGLTTFQAQNQKVMKYRLPL